MEAYAERRPRQPGRPVSNGANGLIKSASADKPFTIYVVDKARHIYPSLGDRQVEVLSMVAAAGDQGTTTGTIWHELIRRYERHFDRAGVHIALSRLSTPRFALQFNPSQIPVLADRYSYPGEERIVGEIGPAARERGYYTRSELIEVCGWKTERSESRVAANTEEEVVETSRLALGARSEALRIWIPTALAGVHWATSSVLLHFGHRDRYPDP
jgi:hypothetical protein